MLTQRIPIPVIRPVRQRTTEYSDTRIVCQGTFYKIKSGGLCGVDKNFVGTQCSVGIECTQIGFVERRAKDKS